MARSHSRQPAQAGLKASGQSFWSATVEEFELDESEVAVLREVCRTLDTIDELQRQVDRDGVLGDSPQGVRVNPAVGELRQQRLALTKLLAALAIPTVDDDAVAAKKRRYGIRGAV